MAARRELQSFGVCQACFQRKCCLRGDGLRKSGVDIGLCQQVYLYALQRIAAGDKQQCQPDCNPAVRHDGKSLLTRRWHIALPEPLRLRGNLLFFPLLYSRFNRVRSVRNRRCHVLFPETLPRLQRPPVPQERERTGQCAPRLRQ